MRNPTAGTPLLDQVQLRYDVLSDVGTGRLVGLHAVPVWEHPTWGPLPADDAWAATGRSGHQPALLRRVLQSACADAAALPGTVVVGVSLPAELASADTLPADVDAALTDSGLAPGRLALSFPEELLRRAPRGLVPALHAVSGAGVRLALADYGLGTTLWGLLTRVPLDAVVVSLHTLGTTGGSERALRVLQNVTAAALEVGVRTIVGDVGSTDVLARVGAVGALAMTGPLLPSGLTTADVARLLTPLAA